MRYNHGEQPVHANWQMLLRRAAAGPEAVVEPSGPRPFPRHSAHPRACPGGIHDREDKCHWGFKAFLTFMKWFQPRYLMHGHIHLYELNEVRRTQLPQHRSGELLRPPGSGGRPCLRTTRSTGQAQADFNKARARRSSSAACCNISIRRRTGLLNFHEIQLAAQAPGRDLPRHAGGRHREHHRERGPVPRLQRRLSAQERARPHRGGSRWTRPTSRTSSFRPIQLYKVGTWYFVRDGNHRVSVARMQGVRGHRRRSHRARRLSTSSTGSKTQRRTGG